MKTALLIGGTAATGVAIVGELCAWGFEVATYHTGNREVPEIASVLDGN